MICQHVKCDCVWWNIVFASCSFSWYEAIIRSSITYQLHKFAKCLTKSLLFTCLCCEKLWLEKCVLRNTWHSLVFLWNVVVFWGISPKHNFLLNSELYFRRHLRHILSSVPVSMLCRDICPTGLSLHTCPELLWRPHLPANHTETASHLHNIKPFTYSDIFLSP